MTRRLRSPHDELDLLHSKSADGLARALANIQTARLRGDFDLVERRMDALGVALGRMLAAADLLGRRRLLLELRAAGLEPPAGEGPSGALFVAKVPFLEAIKDILRREPTLAEGWEATRDAWDQRGFALARSSSLTVTKSVQETIGRFLRQGVVTSVDDAIQAIQDSLLTQTVGGPGGFTRAYAETVFRTTTASAYQAGRAAQAQRPAVKRVVSGWRYQATLDPDVRDNHKAGDDFVAHVDDPVWDTHAPPNGHQCRCATEFVTTEVMVELGLSNEDGSLKKLQVAPAGFSPDPGFRALPQPVG